MKSIAINSSIMCIIILLFACEKPKNVQETSNNASKTSPKKINEKSVPEIKKEINFTEIVTSALIAKNLWLERKGDWFFSDAGAQLVQIKNPQVKIIKLDLVEADTLNGIIWKIGFVCTGSAERQFKFPGSFTNDEVGWSNWRPIPKRGSSNLVWSDGRSYSEPEFIFGEVVSRKNGLINVTKLSLFVNQNLPIPTIEILAYASPNEEPDAWRARRSNQIAKSASNLKELHAFTTYDHRGPSYVDDVTITNGGVIVKSNFGYKSGDKPKFYPFAQLQAINPLSYQAASGYFSFSLNSKPFNILHLKDAENAYMAVFNAYQKFSTDFPAAKNYFTEIKSSQILNEVKNLDSLDDSIDVRKLTVKDLQEKINTTGSFAYVMVEGDNSFKGLLSFHKGEYHFKGDDGYIENGNFSVFITGPRLKILLDGLNNRQAYSLSFSNKKMTSLFFFEDYGRLLYLTPSVGSRIKEKNEKGVGEEENAENSPSPKLDSSALKLGEALKLLVRKSKYDIYNGENKIASGFIFFDKKGGMTISNDFTKIEIVGTMNIIHKEDENNDASPWFLLIQGKHQKGVIKFSLRIQEILDDRIFFLDQDKHRWVIYYK